MDEQARQLLDAAPFPVLMTSLADRKITYLNPAAERLWGATSDVAVGESGSRGWADEKDRALFHEALARDGTVTDLEVLFRRADGSVFWGALSSKVTEFDGRQVSLSSVRDITKRRRAEARLQESERRFRLLAENSLDVIWTLDLRTRRFTYVSPAITKLRGLTVEEALAERLEDSLTPDSLARVQTFLAHQPLPEELPIQVFDQPCRDGSVKHVEISLRYLRDGAGQPVEILGVSRDVSRRVEAEAARERLVEELRRALAEVKRLSGLIPICSWCKKVRDDKGFWSSVEAYLSDRSDALFSHSICPTCEAKHFPDEG
jgi:PAS domain S-box-containing protein